VWALTNSWKIDSKHDDAHPRSAGRHLPLHEPGETSHAARQALWRKEDRDWRDLPMRLEFDAESGALYIGAREGRVEQTLDLAEPGFGAPMDVDG
jgi:hypothetical protein